MRTRRLSAGRQQDVAEAARLLLAGGLVAFPTETVYGLGALALDGLAARGIFAAKGRPRNNPLIVHVPSAAEARGLVAAWPEVAERLARAFWPGPLTLVLPRAPHVPDEVTAGGGTVAVRAPGHPAAQALLHAVGAPLAAPSANRSEHVSPTSAEHALKDLDGRIDAVLDGGPCAVGIESTVLALAPGGPRLLRPGAVSREALAALVGPVALGSPPHAGPAALPSPGMLARHYAPAAVVRLAPAALVAEEARALLAGPGRPSVGALLCGDGVPVPAGAHGLRLPRDPSGYARALYAALRDLEDLGCSALVVEEVPGDGAWEAVRDRLSRAAG